MPRRQTKCLLLILELVLSVSAAAVRQADAQEIFSDGFESADTTQWSVSTAFQPSDLPGLWGWWDANYGIETADGRVVRWNGKTGMGRDWTQAVPANRPKYVPTHHAGHPAIEWSQFNDDWLDLADHINPSGNDIELFTVTRSTLDFKWASVIQQRNTPGVGRPWLFHAGDELETHIGGVALQAIDAIGAFDVNVYHMTHDDSEGYLALFKNGIELASTTGVVAESCEGALYMGRNADGRFNFEGYIYEVVIFSRSLTPAERTSVVGYLQQKWQTEWPEPSVSPSDVPGLWAWWKADEGVISGVGGIAYWLDQSGNDVALQQSIFGRRPQLVTNARNGLPGILIDNIDDHLETLEHTLDFAVEDATVILVMDTDNDNAAVIAGLDGPTGVGRAWFENEPGVGRVYIGGFPAPLSLDNGGVLGPAILTVFFDSDLGVTQYGVNEWIWGTATNVVGELNPDGGTRVGNAKFDQNVFDGFIYEIVVYNRALSWSERQRIVNYLNGRWSIF